MGTVQPTTPSQTVGPFFALPGALPWSDGPLVVPEGTPGAIRISGRVFDGDGAPVPDALIETWQADPDGRFSHPDDPRGPSIPRQATADAADRVAGNGAGRGAGSAGSAAGRDADPAAGGAGAAGWALGHGPGFRGLGRCPTDTDGRYWFLTLKPGPVPAPGNGLQAPHIDVSVLARGMLNRVVTRIYFPDETTTNEHDPVLSTIDEPGQRATLVAVAEDGGLRFDIHLQGSDETVFFDV
ncbi:protocatechuate 3,4-dioxygenase subunit alpha [Rugosimonospora africana]|uniref:Protocatechuate 3,4-dioxygenase subunit alpha n=1 Tax=Rugosimonospora africana TaxID=556532 RepID=A0A8J3R0I2_9ACTN|nr:protocatechuate 3,4-dioxygenase subunit alpha [Rugosimonospora africana]GIH19130.1 protocatechuate 3,4-dioxygenase subunit alpha [Rugosimonospora africana]